MRLLVLGGTREAARLAELVGAAGHEVTVSLAGRTREPVPVAGTVRTGGFGGADGLAAYLRDHRIERLVDATHPFAGAISANAVRASEIARVPRVALHRPSWLALTGDDWTAVPSLEAAANALPSRCHALLALGRQHLAPFLARDDVRFTARMIEAPSPEVAARMEVVRARPSAEWQKEASFLREREITHLVSRNSGGSGAYAKIEAARALGIPVVMIDRPPAPAPPCVESAQEVIAWLARGSLSSHDS